MQDRTIFSTRAHWMARFVDLARRAMRDDNKLSSVLLSCSQYWCDEADDAVQFDLIGSPDVIPLSRRIDLGASWQIFPLDSNGEAVWAFGAMCVEEGYEEESGQLTGPVRVYRSVDNPVAIAQRDGDLVRATWLGTPHRPWLDHAAGFSDREYGGKPATLVTKPLREPTAREQELIELLLAGDDGALGVLHDLWIERGDPRGDVWPIAGTPSMSHRVADLVAEYGRAWLGALDPVITLAGALFGPGPFVRKAIVDCDAAAFAAVADAPEWGTVEAIEFAPGSHRGISPRMHRLRAVGPVGPAELALLTTPIEELDYEGDLAALIAFAAPLRTLRLRAGELPPDVECAPWWNTLERFELWLPYLAAEDAYRMVAISDGANRWLPDRISFGIGALHCGMRGGWMLTRDATGRHLEIERPGIRDDLGLRLSAETGLKRTARLLEGDDWLALALGVRSTVPLS